MDIKAIQKELEKLGIKPLPEDHPIYSEPPSIHFIKQSSGFTATKPEPPNVPTARPDEEPTQSG